MSILFDWFMNFEAADWLGIALQIVLVYFFVLWAALVIWVARDVVARTKNIAFHVVAILLIIFLNFFGLLIYLILRPQKTLAESYYESLEQKVLGEEEEHCPSCQHDLPLSFHYCPRCGTEARTPCKKCKKLVSKDWQACAHCGAKQGTKA